MIRHTNTTAKWMSTRRQSPGNFWGLAPSGPQKFLGRPIDSGRYGVAMPCRESYTPGGRRTVTRRAYSSNFGRIARFRPSSANFQITRKKPVWLLRVTFVISEGSELVPGYSTCLVLNLRPHGDWVMSFNDFLEGAHRGLVSSRGQKLAHFPFLLVRHTSGTNHKTSMP